MSDSESEEDIISEEQIKIVILGDALVGKTCILRRFCYDEFSRQYNPTVGAEFYLKRITILGDRQIVLKITDIGGNELSGNMLDKYLFDTNIAILLYDITSVSSFDNMSKWLKYLLNSNSATTTKPTSVIVGNKCDLEHQRAVRLDRTKQFAEEHGLPSHCVSAKTGESVNLCIMNSVVRYLGIANHNTESESQQLQNMIKVENVTTNTNQNSNTSVCTIQ